VSGSSVPTGTVTFMDGTTTLGSVSLDTGGQATLTTSSLAAVTHSITAVYGGGGSFNGSTSPALSQVVNRAPASVTPDAASKTYGAADPALSGALSGFEAGDGVTASYSRAAGETVAGGPYTISASLTPAAVLANYTITSNTASFTIAAKAASVTPNAASKIYGAADPALS